MYKINSLPVKNMTISCIIRQVFIFIFRTFWHDRRRIFKEIRAKDN